MKIISVIQDSSFEKKEFIRKGEKYILPKEMVDKVKDGWELSIIEIPEGSVIVEMTLEEALSVKKIK